MIASAIGWKVVKAAALFVTLLLVADVIVDNVINGLDGDHETEENNVDEGDRLQLVSEADHQLVMSLTEFCLPKLVCELFKADPSILSDTEQHLVDLIGSGRSLGGMGSVSKFVFAAHMGQLSRGFEGQGCHHFYPQCPFSSDEVRAIAAKIKL